MAYCEFDLSLESAGEENVLIDDHAIYGIAMDLYLAIGLIWEHPSEVHHSLAARWKNGSILVAVLRLPDLQSEQLIADLIRTFL